MFVIKDEEGNNALSIFYYFIYVLSMWNIHEYSNYDLHVVCWTQQTYLAMRAATELTVSWDLCQILWRSIQDPISHHQISVNSLKPH